jgi:hypothetical protein
MPKFMVRSNNRFYGGSKKRDLEVTGYPVTLPEYPVLRLFRRKASGEHLLYEELSGTIVGRGASYEEARNNALSGIAKAGIENVEKAIADFAAEEEQEEIRQRLST